MALRILVFAEVTNFSILLKVLPKGLFLKLSASFARNCFNCAKCFAFSAFAAASTGLLKRDLSGVNDPAPTPGNTPPCNATFGNCAFALALLGMVRELALFTAADSLVGAMFEAKGGICPAVMRDVFPSPLNFVRAFAAIGLAKFSNGFPNDLTAPSNPSASANPKPWATTGKTRNTPAKTQACQGAAMIIFPRLSNIILKIS